MPTDSSTTPIPPHFEISTDPARLDVDLIHRFLGSSYWAADRTRDVIERSIRHSLCFGVYGEDGQVGFARVITDRAVFAYLADVFILPEYRGQGLSKALISTILAHRELQGLTVFLLRTRDAQGLYAQFGFQPIANPEELMGRSR